MSTTVSFFAFESTAKSRKFSDKYNSLTMGYSTTVTLKISDIKDFRRVWKYVKPDEADTRPQTDEEYGQAIAFVENLSGAERMTWMTRHCARLYVNFKAKEEEQELLWSGRNEIGGLAEEIAELVVAQFPDVDFRIASVCDGGPDFKFGLSENGKGKWLELTDDVNEMIEWGIDVDPYTGPTPENIEELEKCRKARN